MNYADIKYPDIGNGPGIRVSLFVSGCRLNCFNCFNKEAQSFLYGNVFSEQTIEHIIELLKPNYVQGLSLLGGDPLEKENQPDVLMLLRKINEIYGDKKDIYLWTGRIFPKDMIEYGSVYLPKITNEIISYIDVLIDGPFVQELHSKTLKLRGSSNQKIHNLKEKRKNEGF